MDLTWLQNKKVKMWLEIGLAVLLALFLGTVGAKLSGKNDVQSKTEAVDKAEKENQTAKKKTKKDTEAVGVKEKMVQKKRMEQKKKRKK